MVLNAIQVEKTSQSLHRILWALFKAPRAEKAGYFKTPTNQYELSVNAFYGKEKLINPCQSKQKSFYPQKTTVIQPTQMEPTPPTSPVVTHVASPIPVCPTPVDTTHQPKKNATKQIILKDKIQGSIIENHGLEQAIRHCSDIQLGNQLRQRYR